MLWWKSREWSIDDRVLQDTELCVDVVFGLVSPQGESRVLLVFLALVSSQIMQRRTRIKEKKFTQGLALQRQPWATFRWPSSGMPLDAYSGFHFTQRGLYLWTSPVGRKLFKFSDWFELG